MEELQVRGRLGLDLAIRSEGDELPKASCRYIPT